jgi:hypothetical protein
LIRVQDDTFSGGQDFRRSVV